MNNDLISRSALLELAHNHVGGTVDCNDIARFPAVDAEVVRCKDCKRHHDSKFGYVVCVWFNKAVRADGYCSYGCKMDAEVEG